MSKTPCPEDINQCECRTHGSAHKGCKQYVTHDQSLSRYLLIRQAKASQLDWHQIRLRLDPAAAPMLVRTRSAKRLPELQDRALYLNSFSLSFPYAAADSLMIRITLAIGLPCAGYAITFTFLS